MYPPPPRIRLHRRPREESRQEFVARLAENVLIELVRRDGYHVNHAILAVDLAKKFVTELEK